MFVILQRSAALIGLLLLSIDYGKFNLGTTYSQLHTLNIITYVLAVFLGGWYGVWLGLYWYRVVYEQGTGGFFHAFIGKFYDSHPVSTVKPKPNVVAPSATKVVVQPRAVDSVGSGDSWEFDDLLHRKMSAIKPVQPRPRVATKEVDTEGVSAEPVVRKTRKTVAKKKTAPKKRTATTRTKAKILADRAEQV